MHNAVQPSLAANNILHMCKGNRAFLLFCDRSCVKMADSFASRGYSLKKQTRWSNDKTIIELGYRKISWFVRVSQIMTIFCATSSNNCQLFAVFFKATVIKLILYINLLSYIIIMTW